jgi:Ni2+-binding GTPase involved in maturation of urease and hydrogenase
MSDLNGNMPLWVNGSFLITIFGMIGAGGTYILLFVLKSRCTNIKCCCISCDRTPLNIDELQTVSIETPPRVITPPMIRNSHSLPHPSLENI